MKKFSAISTTEIALILCTIIALAVLIGTNTFGQLSSMIKSYGVNEYGINAQTKANISALKNSENTQIKQLTTALETIANTASEDGKIETTGALGQVSDADVKSFIETNIKITDDINNITSGEKCKDEAFTQQSELAKALCEIIEEK